MNSINHRTLQSRPLMQHPTDGITARPTRLRADSVTRHRQISIQEMEIELLQFSDTIGKHPPIAWYKPSALRRADWLLMGAIPILGLAVVGSRISQFFSRCDALSQVRQDHPRINQRQAIQGQTLAVLIKWNLTENHSLERLRRVALPSSYPASAPDSQVLMQIADFVRRKEACVVALHETLQTWSAGKVVDNHLDDLQRRIEAIVSDVNRFMATHYYLSVVA